MGSLSNLYISQSYISLLHLGSNNTASSTSTEIQDGLGNGIGVSVNTAGDVALAGTLSIKRGLDITGSVKINTAVTASTQQFVNSGNQFTDNIIRITGSFSTGSVAEPGVYQIQNGWKCFGPGLGDDGATVIANDYVPGTGWRFTIDENTAVWFGLYNFTDPNVQYYNFSVSGSEDITGSLSVRDNFSVTNISASGNISASNLWVKDTIHAYKLDVTIESSSIIFTSGSNILGDEANVDTQTLIGRVKVSGSLEVTGSTRINGNVDSTGSLKVTSDISSSTISGIGNVTLYSASVDSRISTTSASLALFSGSQYKTDSASFQSQITTNSASFAAYSSSLQATFATQAELNLSSSQLQSNINTKLDTASFNSWTNSVYIPFSTSVDSRLDLEEFKSTTFATTGSNSFVGNQTITGSVIISSSIDNDFIVIGKSIYSGSVRGNVVSMSISSQTASMDCSLGNFFTITLVGGSTTYLTATNINAGETLSLRVTQPSGSFGNLTSNNSVIKFPQAFPYIATLASEAIDILSFQSFDTSSLLGVGINKLV